MAYRDNSYVLYVNGNQIGSGIGFQTAKVFTAALQFNASNVFAVLAAQYRTSSAAIIATVLITYSDGTTDSDQFTTDSSWRTVWNRRRAPLCFAYCE
jgi:hypothetical protein